MKSRILSSLGFFVFLTFLLAGPLAAQKDFLKYKLTATPAKVVVNRMPPIPATKYTESFAFAVSNPTRTDFTGQAPTSQLYDVIVSRVVGGKREEVWRWSAGQVFAQVLTPVKIEAGKSWQQTARWEFTANDVTDGDYVAVANYIPTGGKAETKFKITSTQ
jgi:intracellular proteinase inhibitor BsuPI